METPPATPPPTDADEPAPDAPHPAASRWRGWVWLALRLAVAAAGLAYIISVVQWREYIDEHGVTQPGFLARLAEADPRWLVLGLVLVSPLVLVASWRWWVLLRGVEVHHAWRSVLRLTWAGQFLNYAVPVGSTGGDVVRAVVGARWAEPGKKASAVLSLGADRAAGLAGLLVLAGLAGLTQMHEPTVRMVTAVAWALLASGLLGLALYAWPWSHRRLGFERMKSWPGVGRLLAVADAYRARRFAPVGSAVAVSVLVHAVLASSAACAGYALGLAAPPALLLAVLPVVFVSAALPLTYQGLGVMEGVALALLGGDPATDNAVVGMLLIHRMYLLTIALPGAWAMVGLKSAHPPRPDPTRPVTQA